MKRQSSPTQERPHKVPRLNNAADSSREAFECRPLKTAHQNFSQNFPFFREPKEVGCFSLNEDRLFQNDNSQLKYFCRPSEVQGLDYNLRCGYNTFIRQDENDVNNPIDDILQWIQLHPEKFQLSSTPSSDPKDNGKIFTDFISWRGLLTKILLTPYEDKEGWIVAVIRFRDTFYMCEYITQERIQERHNMTERQDEMSYWGYKFEQYMVSGKPDRKPEDPSTPVNSKANYSVVVRSRLQSHSLVFAGEVDCCDSKDHTEYIELKTSRIISHPRQEGSFKRFKLKKWWAQSFLLGIPKIICGFRDDDGIVKELKTYKTLEIPNMVKGPPNTWNAGVCFNFLDAFLSLVKKVAVENDPRVPFVFRYNPKSSKEVTVECARGDETFMFLPDWYVKDDQGEQSGKKILITDIT